MSPEDKEEDGIMNHVLIMQLFCAATGIRVEHKIHRHIVNHTVVVLVLGVLFAVTTSGSPPNQPIHVIRANHGIDPSQSCEGPKCVGDSVNCRIDIEYNDDCGDAIKIRGAWFILDPDGSPTRLPATGNLWVFEATGNATVQVSLGDPPVPLDSPLFVGPPGSTNFGLLGLPNPGIR